MSVDPRFGERHLQQLMRQEQQKFEELKLQLQKLLGPAEQLKAQHAENEMVLKELENTDSLEGRVYKLVGPALIRQDVDDAVMQVQRRIEFIHGQIQDANAGIEKVQKEIGECQGRMMRWQQLFQAHMQRQAQRQQQASGKN
ncbi:MAG: hypothetical protein MHM6MM_002193 [Cercozoa sp. M6MM]